MLMNNIFATRVKRKELRTNMTQEETILWNTLKNKKILNYKFRRQHSIGNYILDFYCPELKLCIELDGKYHFNDQGENLDANRDLNLAFAGIKTLRFENNLIRENLNDVIESIKFEISKRPKRQTYMNIR